MKIKKGTTIHVNLGNDWLEPATVLAQVDSGLSLSWDMRGTEYYGILETCYVKQMANGDKRWLQADYSDVRVSFCVSLDGFQRGVAA